MTIEHPGFRLDIPEWTVGAGEYVLLTGKSGSGKTLFLEVLCGLSTARQGLIHLEGKDVTHFDPADRGIGYVPQDGALFPRMTVREHLG
ncbi:MAG: ATP-binding cassette domain-containing protein, partial [Planctomycetes bacterium]|nr:ATP-binding cassette domain-containing protein [Planctomycetota bacterium]